MKSLKVQFTKASYAATFKAFIVSRHGGEMVENQTEGFWEVIFPVADFMAAVELKNQVWDELEKMPRRMVMDAHFLLPLREEDGTPSSAISIAKAINPMFNVIYKNYKEGNFRVARVTAEGTWENSPRLYKTLVNAIKRGRIWRGSVATVLNWDESTLAENRFRVCFLDLKEGQIGEVIASRLNP